MAMLEQVKAALRVVADDFDGELGDIIDAAKRDLGIYNVKVKDDDPLIVRAVVLYCKANFGFDPDGPRYQAAYDMLKGSLGLAGDYRADTAK